MKKKGSYDYYLILITVAVLFVISLICIYGMFYFKLARIHQMPEVIKAGYMNRMNIIISPFLVALIMLLGICVPKRLLAMSRLNWFAVVLLAAAAVFSFFFGIRIGLLTILIASLVLQLWVLIMALAGSQLLHFEKKGYWVRVGSSLIHLGLIVFILDIFLYNMYMLHLVLFWVTTIATVLGMFFCFYSGFMVNLIKGSLKKTAV
ncbi:MAG: hypothetical protein U9O82_05120 [Thermodesulfobacteriota bacterium]|nr:hypothetical protein [Thermodesulfobacteriota bacterium]